MRRYSPGLLAASLIVSACDGTTMEHAPSATAILTADAFATLPRLTLELLMPVCDNVGPKMQCELGPTGEVISDGGSQLVANDPAQGTLRRIDAATGAVRSLGRPGTGPGEYRMLVSVGFDSTGKVTAFDAVQRKTIRFDSAGRAGESSHPALPGGIIAAGFIGGDLWAVGGDIEGVTANGDSVPILLFRVNTKGRFRKTATLSLRQPGRGLEDMRPPVPIFAAQELWHFTSSGTVLHTDGDAIVVDVHDTTGRHLLRFGAAGLPRAITDVEFQREFDLRTSRTPGGAMGRAMREQAAQRAPYHAAITAMRQLENGEIWLREAPREAGDSVGWVVFTRDGAPIGRLTLPAELRILAASDSRLVVLPPATDRPAVLTWATLHGGNE